MPTRQARKTTRFLLPLVLVVLVLAATSALGGACGGAMRSAPVTRQASAGGEGIAAYFSCMSPPAPSPSAAPVRSPSATAAGG